MPRIVRYGLIGALALAGVLLLVLALASGNSPAFERNYPLLLTLNGVIALVLFTVVTALSLRLAGRVRKGRFGARLMTRFALAFALIGVAPGVMVYLVSTLFISRSIESWFNVQVEGALNSGLELGRAVLEAQRDELKTRAQAMAAELADTSAADQIRKLDQLRERAGADEALWVTAAGSLIGSSTARAGRLMPMLPSPSTLRAAQARGLAVIEGDEESIEPSGGLRTRVIVPVPPPSPPALRATTSSMASTETGLRQLEPEIRLVEPSFLQLTRSVAPDVAANAQALRAGYGQYQQLSLSRTGLQKMYRLTLTLTLLLAIFAAIASGVMLAGSMTAPLIELAAGTRAVSEGDYRPVREFRGNDELNVLTRSFNEMTRQLSDARETVEARSLELETARGFLQRVLSNLSAGVIVLDADSRIVTANLGAGRILGVALAHRVGDRLSDVHPQLADQVASAFRDHSLAATPKDSWQRQIKLDRAGAPAGAEPLSLLARGSRLPLDARPGSVIVFDDITQVISAQRAVAWGEVARRLAHEIKNPLTPIQLAAERLQMKLAGELTADQAEVLVRGASTIVNQVAAMKRMVDEFREYARLPPAQLTPLDLNALVEEIGALYGADARLEHGDAEEGDRSGAVRIVLRLSASLPMIEGDASHLRQLIHNLVANAQESITGAQASVAARDGGGRIVIRTEAVTIDEPSSGSASPSRAVRLSVEDNGAGFPANILRRAFEPYVTTKPRGTGLGLAMVKKIVDEHDARIDLINRVGGAGATVTVVFRHVVEVAIAG
ncbi:MAG TPA: ATP-binding protein [Burkholderiaceae bacterium]|nr:ATP-binding protein [Burkholderiaceae bacterium]